MATYTALNLTSAIADLKAALNAQSLITEVKYESATDLVFTTPLTSKVIRIYINNSSYTVNAYYGDSWTSETTITNSVQFAYQYPTTSSNIHVVSDTTFFAIITQTSGGAGIIAYVGSMDNDDVLVFGVTTFSSYPSNNLTKNLTDGSTLLPLTFARDFCDSSSNIYTYDLRWFNASTGILEMNGTSPAKTRGVKCSSAKLSSTFVKGGTYLIVPAAYYQATYGQIVYLSMIFEFS